MKTMSIMLIITLLFSIIGCGLVSYPYIYYNFEHGKTQVATVGSVMVEQKIVYRNNVYNQVVRMDVAVLEYGGKTGTVIKVYYKEFGASREGLSVNNYARPAFTQELVYDLAESDTISYKSTSIRVVSANGQQIRFEVLDSPLYKYSQGQELR